MKLRCTIPPPLTCSPPGRLNPFPAPDLQLIREAIREETGVELVEAPATPVIKSYGKVPLNQTVQLLESLGDLVPEGPANVDLPDIMENFNQS